MAAAGNATPEAWSELQYDASEPLEMIVDSRNRVGPLSIFEIYYRGPLGGEVSSFIVAPDAPGSYAGIVLLHPATSDRSHFLSEARALAAQGAVCLLADAPFCRKSPTRRKALGLADPAGTRALTAECVLDLRRGLDLLCSRTDVDRSRLAFVGRNYGAAIGGVLAGVEKRLSAAVLLAGIPSLSAFWARSPHPVAAKAREAVTPEQVAEFERATAPLDSIQWLPRSQGARVLLQFGAGDDWIPKADADALVAAAREPKSALWYEDGHDLRCEAALADYRGWLAPLLVRPLRSELK